MCMLANTPIAATDIKIAPHAQLNEGCFDLVLVHDMTILEEVGTKKKDLNL